LRRLLDEICDIYYKAVTSALLGFSKKERAVKSTKFFAVLASALALAACAQVGGLAQAVGGGLTNFSNSEGAKDTFLGKAAGVGGNVYTKAGRIVGGEKK
jgi:hypothetical protein